jgi:hypothetical protein
MAENFISIRSWVIFLGTEFILAGILLWFNALSPLLLVIIGATILSLLWLWDNRPSIIQSWFRRLGLNPSWLAEAGRTKIDAPSGWSVSFATSGVVFSWKNEIVFDTWRFVNVSTNVERIIDATITIPDETEHGRMIQFNTEYYSPSNFSPDQSVRARGRSVIRFPLDLAPTEISEGYLAFKVKVDDPPALLERLNLNAGRVKITDRISGRSIEIPLGEEYNAITNETYDPRHPTKYVRRSALSFARKLALRLRS